MITSRISATALAIALSGCAIPPEDLNSLLASQGVVSPWRVDQFRRAPFNASWLVVVRDELRQIAPMICTTHERSFDARESPDGYRIQPGFVRQEFALNDCAEVTESDFGSVSVIDQVGPSGTRASELDDRALIKFISPLTAMSRIASAQAQTVRLHYNGSFDVDRLRRFLAQIDPRSIDYVAVDLMRQRTVISIEINDNHFSVTFAFDNDRLTDIEVVDTVLIF